MTYYRLFLEKLRNVCNDCIIIHTNGVCTTNPSRKEIECCNVMINTWNAKNVEDYVVYAKSFGLKDDVNYFALFMFNIYVKGPVKLRISAKRKRFVAAVMLQKIWRAYVSKKKMNTLQAFTNKTSERGESPCSVVYPIPVRLTTLFNELFPIVE